VNRNWANTWDEWIPNDSDRLALAYTHTTGPHVPTGAWQAPSSSSEQLGETLLLQSVDNPDGVSSLDEGANNLIRSDASATTWRDSSFLNRGQAVVEITLKQPAIGAH